MTFAMGARMGSITVASVLFAVGCMSSEDKGSQSETAKGTDNGSMNGNGTGSAVAGAVTVTKLASDQTGGATNLASSMVNAWGMVSYQGMFWIANEGTGLVSIVDGNGLPTTGRPASDTLDLGKGITGVAVTGLAADDMTSFQIHIPDMCAAAQLIFANGNGTLIGVNPTLTTKGLVVVDRSAVGASYTGVAVVQGATGPVVLAADFHNARIDVFDANFSLVTNLSLTVPSLPAGLAPFNVMAFDKTIYVTYAQQDADKKDAVAGPGLGVVAAFDLSGKLLGTAKGDAFNAPWGMAMARGFTPFPNALLVGNFGDGHITAVDPVQLTVQGQLTDAAGMATTVDGLWGISFGDGVTNARAGGLYFAAGPGDEAHGMFGVIAAAPITAPAP
jgi:uncharacterized protein (TIGR03118 family)